MNKFFIVTDIDGTIVSEDFQFATELEANDWIKKERDSEFLSSKERYFVEMVIESL